MKIYHIVGFASVFGLIATACAHYLWDEGEQGSLVQSVESRAVATQAEASSFVGAHPDSGNSLAALPRDDRVADIQIDGAVRVDMNGNLVLDRALRRFLDFFVGLAPGQRFEDALRQRIRAVMADNGIPSVIQKEVLSILMRYLSYREAAGAIGTEGSHDPFDVRATFDELYSLRREYLGPDVAEGFYGEEERRFRLALDRERILADTSLTEEGKARALDQLDQLLPEHVRQTREVSETVVATVRQVQQMRTSGASESQIRALRLQRYGREATERLEELDFRRQQWQARVSHYQRRKQQILQGEGLASDDRERALETLRAEVFQSEHELRRIRALDKASQSRDSGT